MNLFVVAPLYGRSGYGQACRNYVRAMLRVPGLSITAKALVFDTHIDDMPLEIEEVILPRGDSEAAEQKALADADASFFYSMPDMWPRLQHLRHPRRAIGMTIWEQPPLPQGWAKVINESVDELWLPNWWVASIFKQSGVRLPIKVVPHCEDPGPYTADGDQKATMRKAIGLPADAFIFYSIFDWSPRKAPLDLCTAFLKAFPGQSSPLLFLKLHTGGYGPSQLPSPASVIAQAREATGNHTTRIWFYDGGWTQHLMMALRHAADCFVSLTRSEGWGLPQFEAALCGTPVITTGWGGVTAFLRDDSAYFIDYKLATVDWELIRRLEPRQQWAIADIDHAANLMQYVEGHREEAAVVGRRAQAFCAERFSLEAVAKIIGEALNAGS